MKGSQGICEFVDIFAYLQMRTKVVPFVHLPVCLREIPQEQMQKVSLNPILEGELRLSTHSSFG